MTVASRRAIAAMCCAMAVLCACTTGIAAMERMAPLVVAPPEATQGLPAPTVVYQTNPNGPNHQDIVPTATPLVLNSVTAFVCYAEIYDPFAYCQMVSPANGAFHGPKVTLQSTDYARFDNPPLPLGPVSALYSTSWESGSYWGASSDMLATPAQTRYNSTAMPATDPNTFSAFVPFGVHEGDDFLMGFNTLVLNNVSWLYNLNPWASRGKTYPNGLSLLHDVIYYRGLLLFMHNNTFYKYNASTGMLIFSVPNPCNVNVLQDSMNLAKGTFGSDANGDLDAFVVYGNTSTQNAKEFVVCRVSHLTGALKWKYTMAEDFIVDDIIGGSGLLLITGSALSRGSEEFGTLILDASSNVSYGILRRSVSDFQGYPVFVPAYTMPGHCGQGIVMQQHNNLTAYCVNSILNGSLRDPQWVSKYECNYRAVYDPISTQLVCSSVGSSVISIMAGSGIPVWLDESRAPLSQPVLMIELGVSYAFVLDIDATLWGYQIPLVAPTNAPLTQTPNHAPTPAPTPAPSTSVPSQGNPPSGGLSGGAAAGIAIGVILAAVGAAVGAALVVRQRRRQAYQPTTTNLNEEYGSIS